MLEKVYYKNVTCNEKSYTSPLSILYLTMLLNYKS